jgi:hypothetical protein
MPTSPSVPTRDSIRPSVNAAVVYDDNVFARVDRLSDVFFRVSPSIIATKADPRRTLTLSYGFDAERYDRYDELSQIQARQNALFVGAFRPNPRRRFELRGGYLETNNPTELNELTSLAAGRSTSSRIDAAASMQQDFSRTTMLQVGYAGNRDKFRDVLTVTNGVDARLGRKLGTRSDIFIGGSTRRFEFGSLGGTTVSNQITGGYAWRTRTFLLSASGGASRTNGQLMGTGDVSFAKTIGLSSVTGRYTRETTTAVGIPGAILVDHVDFHFMRQSRLRTTGGQPRGFRFGTFVALSRNIIATGEARIFDWGFEIFRPITNSLTFAVNYDGMLQQTISGVVFGLGGDVGRNRLAIGIQFAPWSVR